MASKKSSGSPQKINEEGRQEMLEYLGADCNFDQDFQVSVEELGNQNGMIETFGP